MIAQLGVGKPRGFLERLVTTLEYFERFSQLGVEVLEILDPLRALAGKSLCVAGELLFDRAIEVAELPLEFCPES